MFSGFNPFRFGGPIPLTHRPQSQSSQSSSGNSSIDGGSAAKPHDLSSFSSHDEPGATSQRKVSDQRDRVPPHAATVAELRESSDHRVALPRRDAVFPQRSSTSNASSNGSALSPDVIPDPRQAKVSKPVPEKSVTAPRKPTSSWQSRFYQSVFERNPTSDDAGARSKGDDGAAHDKKKRPVFHVQPASKPVHQEPPQLHLPSKQVTVGSHRGALPATPPSVELFIQLAMSVWDGIHERHEALFTTDVDRYRRFQEEAYGELLPSFPLFPSTGSATRKRNRDDSRSPASTRCDPSWTSAPIVATSSTGHRDPTQLPQRPIYTVEDAMERVFTGKNKFLEPSCVFIALVYLERLAKMASFHGFDADDDAAPPLTNYHHHTTHSTQHCTKSIQPALFFPHHQWLYFTLLLALAHKYHGEASYSFSFFIQQLPKELLSSGGIRSRWAPILAMDYELMEFHILKIFDFNLTVHPSDIAETLGNYLPQDQVHYVCRQLRLSGLAH